MTQLHLAWLGPPEVHFGEQAVAFATRKTLALLAYLTVEGGMQPRQKLMTLLWPESDEKRGRGALRITLLYLRRALDTAGPHGSDPYLRITSDALGFNFDADFTQDTDLPPIAKSPDLPISLLQTALDAYRGPFLDGFSLPDAPAFDEWVTWRREQFHRQITLLFDRLTQQQSAAHLFAAGIVTAGRWLAHDPLNEAAHRRLMQLHALSGNKTAALQAYDTCRQLLQAELGIEPSLKTQALANKIYDLQYAKRSRTATFTIYDLEEVPVKRQLPIPFVGRSEEHGRLAAIFQVARQGQTQVTIIEGEPGIGKTRLAQEFLNWMTVQGADILTGRAFEAGGRLPYQPLVEALRARIESENAPEDLLSDVWLAELSRLLPELRDRYPDLPPPTADEMLARTRLLEAIARLGGALARKSARSFRQPTGQQPVVLFIDDIQWADAASLDSLFYCLRVWAEQSLPWLLLLTLRSEEAGANPPLVEWLTHLARAVPVTRVNLTPITAVATTELVQALAEQSAAAPPLQAVTLSFAQWLYRETAGHPFFINETLKALREQGEPDRQDWMARPEKGLVVPGVRQLILARLHRLSPQAFNLLTAVAVLGRPCTFARICRVAGVVEEEALPGLDALLNSQLLLETATSTSLSASVTTHPYAISHDKIRDVVYTEAGDARRRLYHRRALTALEQENAPAAELAHHALAAHLPEPAFRHSLAAGDEALALFAVRDAITHYEQARIVGSEQLSVTSKQSLYANLSRAYELAGDFDQAKAVGEEMLNLAQQAEDVEMMCAAHNRLATLAIYTHQLETAASHLQQIITIATGHTRWPAEAEWGLAQLAQHRYDMPSAKSHSQRALRLAQEIDAAELTARSLNSLGYAHLLLGDFEAAIGTLADARDRYLALGNRALEADSLTGMAGAIIFQGRAVEAIKVLEEALGIYQAIDNPWGILFSSGWLAAGLLDNGRLAEALAVCLQAADHAHTLGTTPVSIWHHLWTGNAYRALFQLDKAIVAHREAARLNQPHPLRPFAEYIAAELCADYALAGEWEQAHHYARGVLTHRQYQAIPQIILPHWPLTAALLRGGDAALAREDVARRGNLLGRLPRFRVAHLRALAVLAAWEGGGAAAIAHLEDALTLAEEIGLPGEQWQILIKLAQLYPDNARQQTAQNQAAEIVNRLAGQIGDEAIKAQFLASIVVE